MAEEVYVTHTAQMVCSCGSRASILVLQNSHGIYVRNYAQMTVKDCVPNENILNFGGCISMENPDTKKMAEEVVAKAEEQYKEQSKGFFNKIVDFFCSTDAEAEPDESVVAMCMGHCNPCIDPDLMWSMGKEIVELKGDHPLLKGSTILCSYGGEIRLESPGQPE